MKKFEQTICQFCGYIKGHKSDCAILQIEKVRRLRPKNILQWLLKTQTLIEWVERKR